MIALTPHLFRCISVALRLRGPLLLPRFGGKRKILGFHQREEESYLLLETGEWRKLACGEIAQLVHALGLWDRPSPRTSTAPLTARGCLSSQSS